MAIGQLRERVAFQAREFVDDEMGNPQSGEFSDVYECAAQITPKMGGEAVTASRLTGIQPMLVTVRVCDALSKIGTDWRLRDVRAGVIYNIKSFSNPDEKKKYLEILATSGEAT